MASLMRVKQQYLNLRGLKMEKKVVIVGAGGMGREVYNWLSIDRSGINITGFIDDNLSALDGFNYPVGVVSKISNYVPLESTVHVLAIMNPLTKRKVVTTLKSIGCEFISFVHPTAIIGVNVGVGEGNVISPSCILTCDITLGSYVFLNTQTTLGHDVSVGDYTSINGKVDVSGCVEIGGDVIVGSHVVILPQKKIASGAKIGAGSVVVGNINHPVSVFGNPAKMI